MMGNPQLLWVTCIQGIEKQGTGIMSLAWISSQKIPPLTFLPCCLPSFPSWSLGSTEKRPVPDSRDAPADPCLWWGQNYSVNGDNAMPSPLSSWSHQAKGWQQSRGPIHQKFVQWEDFCHSKTSSKRIGSYSVILLTVQLQIRH